MTALLCSPDGAVRCLWTEAVPLATLGRLTVTRASTIEFNPVAQQWEVRLTGGSARAASGAASQREAAHPDFAHASREACLQWERDTLNAQLLS